MSFETSRVAVVTGASAGIGLATVKALASEGWRVIGVGRDRARTAAAGREIGEAPGGERVTMLRADLSVMADVERLARDIAAATDRVDVLVNNAGGMTDRLEMTPEGLEANFAGNHLGPMLLTDRLLPLLRAAAAGAPPGATRILMTSSYASENAPLFDPGNLQNLDRFNPGLAYPTAKLCNVLFARALARRLEGSGIVAHAMVPGPTASNFFSHAPDDTQARTRDLKKHSPETGADTLVWLALADEAGTSSGGYWEKRRPRAPNPIADDAHMVDRCWHESARLIAAAAAHMTA